MRAALLLVAGCGLGPLPDPSGVGASPWRDLGPALVCLGSQGLEPPTAPPGGLCIGATTPEPASCTTDRDCRSREACVCGSCTIAFCAVASDCVAPRSCTFAQHRCDLPCVASRDCRDAEECIAGVCRGRCATSTDCQHGEFCDSNHVCNSDDCADATGCRGGERCELQRVPRQVLEPAPLADGKTIVLYLDLAAPSTPDARAIWRATSRDGVHFAIDPPAPVVDAARAPSAVRDGGTTYLYFEQAGALRVATAADGIAFGAPATLLAGADLHAPSAVHVAGGVVLYYERGGAIGLATGLPETQLTDQGIVLRPAGVVVGDGTPGTAFWIGITELASPHALVAGPAGAQTIHLWFAAFGQESPPAQKFGTTTPIPPNFSVGFAAADPGSPSALAVWPYGPVADRIEAFLDHHDELGPAAVDAGDDRFFLYDVDATHDMSGMFQLGRLEVLGSESTF